MLCLVSGPSSIGKSHFLENAPLQELTGLDRGLPIVFPFENLRPCLKPGFNGFMHYNTLRPAHFISVDSLLIEMKRANVRDVWPGMKPLWNYQIDPKWRKISGSGRKIKAIVLVAAEQTILNRLRGRTTREVNLKSGVKEVPYEEMQWGKIYEMTDLLDIYNIWLNELKQHEIPYELVLCETEEYRIIDQESLQLALKGELV